MVLFCEDSPFTSVYLMAAVVRGGEIEYSCVEQTQNRGTIESRLMDVMDVLIKHE